MEERSPQSLRDVAPSLWVVLLVLLVIVLYWGVSIGGLNIPLQRLPWGILVPSLTLFAIVHSYIMLGPMRAGALLAICVVLAFLSEYIGQSTGTIFGPYCYTGLLGWKLFGRIPLLIPFAWYMMFYPSYIVTNILAEGAPVSQHPGFARIVWLSALGALVMTGWDITMDPVMSFHPGAADPGWCAPHAPAGTLAQQADVGTPAWIWIDGGTHFGVPLSNYRGWLATAFVVFFLYRLVERHVPLRPVHGHRSRLMVYLPVAVYGTMTIIDTWLGYPEIEDIRLISPFVMGIPFLFAAYRVLVGRGDMPLIPARKTEA